MKTESAKFRIGNDYLFVALVWLASMASSITGLFVASVFQDRSFTSMFGRWDALRFVEIVDGGYLTKLPTANGNIMQNRNAFFPGFPNVVRALDVLIPGNQIFAGVVMNCAIAFITFLLFHKTMLLMTTKANSRIGVLYFAFFPGSFIFYWFYAEALTALFIAAAFYYLVNKKVWASSVFVALATMTRPNALPFASMIPLYLILSEIDADFYRLTKARFKRYSKTILKAAGTFAISVSGFVGFMIYLWSITGIPDVWLRTEREGWGESTKPFLRTYSNFTSVFSTDFYLNDFFILFCALLGIVLAVFGAIYIKKMKYSALSIAGYIPSLLVILLALSNNIAPASPRFYAVAVPIFVSLPFCISNRYSRFILPISLLLLGVTSAFYTFANNVA